MTRRLEAGPLLVALGALLLLVSLFLDWFTGGLTAWDAFEAWDVVLFVLALGAIAAAVGLITQDPDVVDRRVLTAAVVAVLVIVASQIIDPPPAATGDDPDTGAWLALAAAVVMVVGALLTFSRVHLALTVEGREPRRRRVSAVDARGPADPTTDSIPAVRPEGAGARLFGRDREAPAGAVAGEPTDDTAPMPRPPVPGAVQADEPGEAPVAGNEPREPKQT